MREIIRDLTIEGQARLERESPLAQVGEPVTIFNRRRMRRAEALGEVLIDVFNNGGKKQVVVATTGEIRRGQVGRRDKSMAAQVEPIYQDIIAERGRRTVSPLNGKELGQDRQTVRSAPSLAEQALRAQKIRKQKARQAQLAQAMEEERQQAGMTLVNLLAEAEEQSGNGSGKKGFLKQLGNGLTKGAAAVVVGEPRAGVERVNFNMRGGAVSIETDSRRGGSTHLAMEKLVDGTFAVGVKLDPLSRILNGFRRLLGKDPVSVLGVGVLTVQNTLTQEVVGGTVVRDPLEKAAELKRGIGAMRVLKKDPPKPVTVPTFADLGLDGPELESQSGVVPYLGPGESTPLPQKEKSLLSRLREELLRK